jgi:ABC-type multidrug transport system fused ATPase/permease subunit
MTEADKEKIVAVSKEDVTVPVDIDADSQRSEFIAAFKKNSGNGQWRKTIFDISKPTFVSDFALQLIGFFTMLLVPYLTARLIDWLPLLGQMPWWNPYLMTLSIWLILITRSLCQNYGITLSAIAACRFSFGLTGAVHQKMTLLSNASKQKFGGGSVANLMAMDPLRFNIVMTVMPHLIIAPFQIFGSIGLLSYYVGWTALAGLAVILLYLPFQFNVSKRLDGIREVNLALVHV